jgi:Selenoprotein, putative
MSDLHTLFDRSARVAGATVYWTTRAARLMVGVPDYETYVAHRRANHPDESIDHDLCGIFPGTPASPLCPEQRAIEGVLLKGTRAEAR